MTTSTRAPDRARGGRTGRAATTARAGAGGTRAGRGTPATRARPAFAVGRGAPRAPFVLLVLLLAGGGLVALLLLNTAIASASFQIQSLRSELDALTVEEQALRQDVTAAEAPGALAQAAKELGMIPSEHPGYLILAPDGSYQFVGEPAPAGSPAPESGDESGDESESGD